LFTKANVVARRNKVKSRQIQHDINYHKISNSHVVELNGNSGFLIKELILGNKHIAKVCVYIPKTNTYLTKWVNKCCIR
jgi:hypothetical protein